MDTSNELNENTPDAPEPAAPSVARLVRTADRLLRIAAHDALRAEDVHPRQLRTLRAVASGHAGLRGGGRALRGLVARGWVQIGADGATVTPEGQDALDRLSGVARDARAAVAASLSAKQVDALTDGLTALVEAAGGEAALERARAERRERLAGRRGVPGFPWGPGLPFAPRFDDRGRGRRAHDAFGARHGHHDDCRGERMHRMGGHVDGRPEGHGRADDCGHGHGERGYDRGHGFDRDEHRGGHGHRHGGRGHHGFDGHRGEHGFQHGDAECGSAHRGRFARHDRRHDGPRRSEQAFERGYAAGLDAARRSHAATDADQR